MPLRPDIAHCELLIAQSESPMSTELLTRWPVFKVLRERCAIGTSHNREWTRMDANKAQLIRVHWRAFAVHSISMPSGCLEQ
jgi:hypothetical protein